MRSRLRKLGVVKGMRNLKSPTPVDRVIRTRSPEPDRAAVSGPDEPDEPLPLTTLIPGITLEKTEVGACLLIDKVYPLVHRHGDSPLAELLQQRTASAACFCRDGRLESLEFRDFLFLDTETTGLSGAGVIPFMVGVAFFEESSSGDAFVVRQYFLRDHGDEPAMLSLLADLVRSRVALVTFNGKAFDLPLLDNRYLMNSMTSPLFDLPHMDLLPPSRRLWRNRLGSCALSALELNLLGVRRTQEDVPGWLIPGLYHQYLRSGDARELLRVFYHNQLDMLSMVTLLSRVVRLFDDAGPEDDPIDLLSLGKWQLNLGVEEPAERNLRLAVAGELPLQLFHQALHQLGSMLKRTDRRDEALPLWQQIAATSFDDVSAHIELAKHFEWQRREIDIAMTWTTRALALVNDALPGDRTGRIGGELEHRLARLQRKWAARQ